MLLPEARQPQHSEDRAARGGEGRGEGVRDVSHDPPAGSIALVQVGVLEFHVWGARADRLDGPIS